MFPAEFHPDPTWSNKRGGPKKNKMSIDMRSVPDPNMHGNTKWTEVETRLNDSDSDHGPQSTGQNPLHQFPRSKSTISL